MFLTGTKKMLGDRIFLQKAVRIALPVAMQGMLNTIVNLVDTMMIGTLGETTIAAVGLANKVFFVFSLLVFGIVSGSGVLAAQYWGNQDIKNIRKVLGLALILALAGAAAFMAPAMICPELVMRIFTVSPETIRIGSAYLIVAAISYPFTSFTNVYVAMLRAVGQVKLPVLTSCLAIVVNITLNFLLIFPAHHHGRRTGDLYLRSRSWRCRRGSGDADRQDRGGGSAGPGGLYAEIPHCLPDPGDVRVYKGVYPPVYQHLYAGHRQ